MFYIENRNPPIGNIAYFWREGGGGYTANIEEAQLFTEQQADKIIDSAKGSHLFIKHHAHDVQSKAYKCVNIDDLTTNKLKPE